MTRNLKVLGMALMAALAISAFGVSAASANPNEEGHFVTALNTETHEPASVLATDFGEENGLVLTWFDGEEVRCDENNFSGEVAGGTTTSLTVETEFGGPQAMQNCEAAGLPATVHNNGCNITFHSPETDLDSEDPDDWNVTTDLLCNEGDIEVTVFTGSSHGFRVCTITVGTHVGLEGVTLDNLAKTPGGEPNPPHDITATVDVDGIEAGKSGLCGVETEQNATMSGEITVTAENEAGEQLDAYVEHIE